MPLTVADAYKLSTLKHARILTGQSGFQNAIVRMGILDYEYISYKIEGSFIKGEFVLSSFLFARDDVQLMSDAVKALIQAGVACLGIKDIYYKELPAELLQYAREHDFSIFLFGHEVYFEDIITEVTDTLRLIDKNQMLEMKVDNLVGNDLSRSLVRELALDINRHFRETFVAINCKPARMIDEGSQFRTLERLKRLEYFSKEHTIFKYKTGMLAILSFDSSEKATPKKASQDFLLKTSLSPGEYAIGVSNRFDYLHEMDRGIMQALTASIACEAEQRSLYLYKDIGLYRLTIPFKDSFWLQDFCTSIIEPLKLYDDKFSTELFNTAVTYTTFGGSIKKTAEALFQHENTIRYRIGKIKEILKMTDDENSDFYPQLSIAVQAYQLRKIL